MTAAISIRNINSTHPAVVYRFLQEKSPELSLQLLPLLTDEQFIRLIDYDIWRKDRLSPLAAIGWLKIYRQISNAEMVRRFRSLDEEYQLAIIAPLINLTSIEEMEKLPVAEQDCYINLPCQELCYRVVAGQHRDIQEFLPLFMEAMLAQDITYTYSLLQHAQGSIANEQEALIAQFRNARIAEDGYYTTVDAMIIFIAVELEEYEQKWQQPAPPTLPALQPTDGRQHDNFLERVIRFSQQHKLFSDEQWQAIQLKIIVCANTLCAATYVEINDSSATRKVLAQTQAMLALALDYLAAGVAEEAARILAAEQAQTLFRVAMTLVARLQQPLLATMHRCSLPQTERLKRLLATHKWQALADLIDIVYLDLLGIANVELLKALFSYSPTVVIDGKLSDVHSMSNYQQIAAQAKELADNILRLEYGNYLNQSSTSQGHTYDI
ncbi:MAG: DUF6178 family protein [Pseudomonadota bacterium]|nr:DUF6178 family protein [Pseudomonadota bacterium]